MFVGGVHATLRSRPTMRLGAVEKIKFGLVTRWASPRPLVASCRGRVEVGGGERGERRCTRDSVVLRAIPNEVSRRRLSKEVPNKALRNARRPFKLPRPTSEETKKVRLSVCSNRQVSKRARHVIRLQALRVLRILT